MRFNESDDLSISMVGGGGDGTLCCIISSLFVWRFSSVITSSELLFIFFFRFGQFESYFELFFVVVLSEFWMPWNNRDETIKL